jgi:hypothetical protein
MRSLVRLCFCPQIASAYGLRDSRTETGKDMKPGERPDSTMKLDTSPKTRFKTAHHHP